MASRPITADPLSLLSAPRSQKGDESNKLQLLGWLPIENIIISMLATLANVQCLEQTVKFRQCLLFIFYYCTVEVLLTL